jgi:hypothetical protein
MSEIVNYVSSLCTPSLIYLVLSIISLLFMIGKNTVFSIIYKFIFGILWTMFLNYLCVNGHITTSWVLLLFPVIILCILLFFAFELLSSFTSTNQGISNKTKNNKSKK